uniref:Macaca fascicularis brain cDNA clone: QflA-16433, similar to human chromosome 14 open reading frame 10 (C14orf10), mRNA, RefSeq: NM_017917.2 n=1 Tax=Macaca fascicularis TaxID=9541 RepID=I7GMB7_MACFA|nr:unnamed protein product [Macaca fascicularis]
MAQCSLEVLDDRMRLHLSKKKKKLCPQNCPVQIIYRIPVAGHGGSCL